MVNKSSTLLVAAVLISATSTLAAPETLLSSGASLEGREIDEEFDSREPQWAFLGKLFTKATTKIFSKFGHHAASHVAEHALNSGQQQPQQNRRRGLVPLDDEESLFVREPEFDVELLGRESKSSRRRRRRRMKQQQQTMDPTAMDTTQSNSYTTTPTDMGGGDTTPMGTRSLDSIITGGLFVREPEFDVEILGRESKSSRRRRRRRMKQQQQQQTTDPSAIDTTQSNSYPTTPTDMGGDATQMGTRSFDGMNYFEELVGRDFEVNELD